MKKVLAVVLTVAVLGFTAYTADAQVPNVQVYFDANHTQTQTACPGIGLGTLYVVANNWNMWMAAIEYSLVFPPAASFLGDVPSAPVVIGNSVAGIAMSWPIPQDAFGALEVCQVSVFWNCADCTGYSDQTVVVAPYPVSGTVSAVRWPDNVLFTGIGMTSVICPNAVPVEETNWGKVKALYQN